MRIVYGGGRPATMGTLGGASGSGRRAKPKTLTGAAIGRAGGA